MRDRLSQEVTGGIILSWLILGQVPSLDALVGVAITLAGTSLVLRRGAIPEEEPVRVGVEPARAALEAG